MEVTVEKAVYYWVDTSGRHGRQVAKGEEHIMTAGGQGLMIPVKNSVEDIERQPGDGKRHHNGRQHDVNPCGALAFLLRTVPATLHHLLSSPEPKVDVQIADQDEQDG